MWLGRGTDAGVFDTGFVQPFRKSVPGIELAVSYLGANNQSRLAETLGTSDAPDILMIPRPGDYDQLIRQNAVLPLDQYARHFGWTERVFAPARAIGTLEGRLFGLPRSLETMGLFFDASFLRTMPHLRWSTISELEDSATALMRSGYQPFAMGVADLPSSCEWLLSLALNHLCPSHVLAAALQGEGPWTAKGLIQALDRLRSWFDHGWFGNTYFTDTIGEAFARIGAHTAGFSPNGTWIFDTALEVFGKRLNDLAVAPFPTITLDVSPSYMLGTASVIGISRHSTVPDAAAAVLDALFTTSTRRRFARLSPGDWNLPVRDPDLSSPAVGALPQFTSMALGLDSALATNRYGYATWSFLSSAEEAASIDGFRSFIDGKLSSAHYLDAIGQARRL